jgi:O-antigen ligase
MRLPIPYLSFFMLLFAVSAVLGVQFAYDRALTNMALAAVLGSVALYFAIVYFVRSWLAIRLVSGLVLLIATGLAVVFITQYGYQDYPETPRGIEEFGNVTTLRYDLGISLHPNAVAAFLGVTVPLGLMRALTSQAFPRKMSWILCTVIILYAIFLTYSRGAYVALAAVTMLSATIFILRRLPRRTALFIIGLGIIVQGPDDLPLLSSAFSRATDRGRLYQNSLGLAEDYAFTGIGLGDTFAMVYSRYVLMIRVPYLTYAHNLPLAVWLNQGLLGLLSFAGIIITLYTLVYRVMRTVEPLRRLFHGAWLGATVALLHGLTDSPQYADNRWIMPMLFIAIGLTAAGGRVAVTSGLHEGLTPTPVNWRRILVVIAPIVLIVAGIIIFRQPLMAAWYTNLGAVDEARAELAPGPGSIEDQRGDDTRPVVLTESERETYYDSAEAYYRQALALDSTYPNGSRRLGNLLVGRGQYEEAVPLLEAAFATEPGNPAAIKGLALAYVWVGRLEDAVRAAALHDNPDDIASELNTWGNFHNGEGHPLLAARAWETAQLMQPAVNVTVWMRIADSYRSAGDPDNARRWYERVLDIQPDNGDAQQGLALLS